MRQRIVSGLIAIATTALAFGSLAIGADKPPSESDPQNGSTPSRPARSLGIQVNEPEAFGGYTLIAPLLSTRTYLVDMQGRVVHHWESRYTAGEDACLLENGHLLRGANLGENEAFFTGASQGGRIQEFTWEGELVWDYKFHNEKQIRHHAFARLPNGNILMNVWERKTPAELIAAGLKPELAGSSDLLVDCLMEVQPSGKSGGKIVWEWHVWDHLIQDHDATKGNFGDVAGHPGLIDVNYAELLDVSPGLTGGRPVFANLARMAGSLPETDTASGAGGSSDGSQDHTLDRLKAIGYIGANVQRKSIGLLPDWTHCNSVDYNAQLDQVMLSSREFSEIWIIDHSTTTAEAANHRGGRQGKGGDLLYRWGNPKTYRAAAAKDQRLFNQHDARWIPKGLPGAGHVLVFNNGNRRRAGEYSAVDELELPQNAAGEYERKAGARFGPENTLWSYSAPQQTSFFAQYTGGAQRLPNGNTLICTGVEGVVFEVTPQKQTVWRYVNPAKAPHRGTDRPADAPGAGPESQASEFSGGGGLFRAVRYGADFPGLAGKKLTPGKSIEELEDGPPAKKSTGGGS